MNNTLFIASKIKVGYQQRSGTFTDNLGYVIYYDAKNKLRKESSWEGWRDKTIEPNDYENTPQTGFMINKGITRGGEWFSKTTTKVRLWDPRGFEFEISVANLMQILMHSDVSKRDIQQACVYAWSGTELILLPTNSTEYEQSVKHTAKQSMKLSARDLVAGHQYRDKRNSDDWVYLGRYPEYINFREGIETDAGSYRRNDTAISSVRHYTKTKKHAFANMRHKTIAMFSGTDHLSHVTNDEVHPDFAKLTDQFFTEVFSQPVVKLTAEGSPHGHIVRNSGGYLGWKEIEPNKFVRFRMVEPENRTVGGKNEMSKTIVIVKALRVFDPVTQTMLIDDNCGEWLLREIRIANRSYHYNNGSPVFRSRIPGWDENTEVIKKLTEEMSTLIQSMVTNDTPPVYSDFGQNYEKYQKALAEHNGQFISAGQKCADDFQLCHHLMFVQENGNTVEVPSEYSSSYRMHNVIEK